MTTWWHNAQVRDQIEDVFESPEMVTTRFIQAVFEKVLSVGNPKLMHAWFSWSIYRNTSLVHWISYKKRRRPVSISHNCMNFTLGEHHMNCICVKSCLSFARTTRLASKLSRPDMTSDPAFLSKLTKVTLFNKYLTYYSTWVGMLHM